MPRADSSALAVHRVKHEVVDLYIGLYRINAIAIQKESGDSNGGNV